MAASAASRSRPRRNSIGIKSAPKANEWLTGARSSITLTQQLAEDPLTGLLATLAATPQARTDADLWEILRWWQKYLPANGVELAPELRAPDHVLLEVLRRGRICVHEPAARLQVEGDEVCHYAIILIGRCKLRCSRRDQVGWGKAGPDEELVACGAVDRDGLMPLYEVQRGESLQMYPGDRSACYDVAAVEKTTMLLLGKEDYEAILQPFHRQLLSQGMGFFQRLQICADMTANNLERLVRCVKQVRVAKGRTVMRSGDPHRRLWFLLTGSCSALIDVEAAADVKKVHDGDEEWAEQERLKDEEDAIYDPARLSKLRDASYGAEMQQATAAFDEKRKVLAEAACGPFRKALEGSSRATPMLGSCSGAPGSLAARLSKPGMMFGEEALLYDPKDVAGAKYSYTVIADQDSTFYAADFTTWKQLAMNCCTKAIARGVQAQLQRRCGMVVSTKTASKELHWRQHALQHHELGKADWQKLRLPPSTGHEGPSVLQDVNEYLNVVSDHRRQAPDLKNLPTLDALQGTSMGPRCPNNGPGVTKMLTYVSKNPSGEMTSQKYIANLRQICLGTGQRVKSMKSNNPMGETVSAVAEYEVVTRDARLQRSMSQPTSFGTFHQTEYEADLGMTRGTSMPALPRSLPPLADCKIPERDIRTATTVASEASGAFDVQEATSRPGSKASQRPGSQGSQPSSLFGSLGATRPNTSGSVGAGSLGASRPNTSGSVGVGENSSFEMPAQPSVGSGHNSFELGDSGGSRGVKTGGRNAAANHRKKLTSNQRKNKEMKAFVATLTGKSVLALTALPDVRKFCVSALRPAQVDLWFVRTAPDFWHHLQQPTDTFHVLIWDLTKKGVLVDELLQQIRQHDRYSRVPIIVISEGNELSEVVRSTCNFVLFHPLSASMLREALLWCFDRKALGGHAKQEKSEPQDGETCTSFQFLVSTNADAGSSTDVWPPKLQYEGAEEIPRRSSLHNLLVSSGNELQMLVGDTV